MKKKTILALTTAFVMGALAVTPLFAQDTKTANDKLLKAVYEANEADMDLAIEQGADIFMTGRYAKNLLHLLVEDPIAETYSASKDISFLKTYDSKKSVVAQKLIDLGVDVNAKSSSGDTPLMYAAMNNYNKVVETYIKNKADVNAVNNNGDTALIKTIEERYMYGHRINKSRYFDIIKTLIEKGANVNTNRSRALLYAVYASDLSTVKILLDAGSKTNKNIYYNATAIYNKYKRKYDELIDKESKGKLVSQNDIEWRNKDMEITKEIMKLVIPEEVKVEEQKKFQEKMMKAFEENAVYKPQYTLPQ